MKQNVKITDVKTVNELNFYWYEQDYLQLLEVFDFSNASELKDSERLEYLLMAIADVDPPEAAQLVLEYKLSDQLNEGQIQNLSHQMLEDKVAEEYPDPALHFDLFNINQLLYKAYNGTFLNTEASILTVGYSAPLPSELTSEFLMKTLAGGLKENSLIMRLFEDQLNGNEPFGDAYKVIWHFKKVDDSTIEIITSRYWLEESDFAQLEYETEVIEHDERN